MPLLDDWSLEMTGRDVAELEAARHTLPAGTRVNVTFLATEDLATRGAAARAVLAAGLTPVPHIAARRLSDATELTSILSALQGDAAVASVFLVGGDPAQPLGPFSDSLSVIRTGALETAGVRAAGITGYPEGHPDIATSVLWRALEDKARELADRDLDASVTTQFGFDVDPVVAWIEAVRERGIRIPIRVGVPGPAGIKRLLGFARRFGISSSAGIARKYGMSLTNLMGTAGPERFIDTLGERLGPEHGPVALHFYTFGGVRATADWVAGYRGCDADPA